MTLCNKTITESDREIAEKLADEFVVQNSVRKVESCEKELLQYELTYEGDCGIDSVLSRVTPEEVQSSIIEIKKGKEGENRLPKRIYKLFAAQIAIPISLIFSKLFTTSHVPSSLKKADVIPLYKKKGSKIESASYRAIFTLPFIVKLFEEIIYNRLYFYTKDLLDENQHGFRKSRSCETAIATFTQDIYEFLDKPRGKAIAVFIDFSKAFDSVSHEKLIQKLIRNFASKIPPFLIRLMINYFKQRSFRIINGDFISDYYSIKSGVPPGSKLGPLTYSLYINNIGEAINLPYKFYADDAAIYVGCDTFPEGVAKLQLCMNSLETWCNENGLKINASKTKFMMFYKSRDLE